MDDAEALPVTEAVNHLWKCVKKALAANENPAPRRIERMATTAGRELAASTIEGWFKTWSVVPTWEKFEALIMALAAEQDEDWRTLHTTAITADRERKKAERRRKKLGRGTGSAPLDSKPTYRQPDQYYRDDPGSSVTRTHAGDLPAEPSSLRPVPRQLPGAPRLFTGRAYELTVLTGALGPGSDAGSTVTTLVIGGVGGIGKTALALHWAHQNIEQFPDGQLYVNLRGFDPSGTMMPPGVAVRGFLDAFGVEPGAIPVDLDAQAGLYRSLVAGKQILIVLDNAHDTDQIAPLLPGGPSCTVLVTSRHQLMGLVTAYGAQPLNLDMLSEAEARELLARHLGDDRVTAELEAVDELLEICAGLPLALGIVAARAATHPDFTLSVLAEELRGTSDRLDALDAGELHANLRAVFSWSYQALDAEAAKAFSLLGLTPGPDISLAAVANLTAQSPTRARALLRDLEAAY
ncbi:MAG: hypothetical protein LC776_05250, partial [Acidobacteria bacterium]|nr:hypothetical protein [Acidobacteriota bacterium]